MRRPETNPLHRRHSSRCHAAALPNAADDAHAAPADAAADLAAAPADACVVVTTHGKGDTCVLSNSSASTFIL